MDKDAQLPSTMTELHTMLKHSFSKVREEMDDHRESINDNTNEIQENTVIFSDFDQRLSKIEEKLDELSMLVSSIGKTSKREIFLNEREGKVFLVLYTSNSHPLSLQDISRSINYTDFSVKSLLSSLSDKGIPIITKDVDSDVFFELDKAFASQHTRYNLVKIESSLQPLKL